jgi:hypothetical protein
VKTLDLPIGGHQDCLRQAILKSPWGMAFYWLCSFKFLKSLGQISTGVSK